MRTLFIVWALTFTSLLAPQAMIVPRPMVDAKLLACFNGQVLIWHIDGEVRVLRCTQSSFDTYLQSIRRQSNGRHR